MVNMIDNELDLAQLQRASMLRMGQNWQKLGKLNQAIDAYLRVVQEGRGTPESRQAKAALLSIANDFEGEGRYHLAMNIYDRLSESLA
jgi:tetratricopeptide (TPR) repeat protein